MDYGKSEPPTDDRTTLAGAETDPTAVRYNFAEAHRLSERQIKRLKELNTRFSQDLADTLSLITRKRLTANSASFAQVELLDLSDEIPEMPLRFLLEMQPLGVLAFLGLDSELTFSLLQAFLGGQTASATTPNRNLTEVELSVLRDIDRVIVQELEKSWKTQAGHEFTISSQRTASGPDDLALFRGTFLFSVLDYSLENRPATVVLAYPIQVAELVDDAPSGPGRPLGDQGSEITQKALFDRMRASQLVIEGCLQDSSVRLHDLLDLRAGDLLRLDLPLTQPIDVRLNGERRFQAEFLDTQVKKSLRIQNLFSK